MAAAVVKACEFVPVLGMPTRVIKYCIDSACNTGCQDRLFLVIPGNPGVADYYDEFMKRLCTITHTPAWSVSHAGHVLPPEDGKQELYKKLSYELCSLEGQIRHKVAFIKENIPKDVKLILIGHSIGCYIILKILSQLKHRMLRCYMLFPTVERMAVSPNGRVYTPLLKYARWLAPILARTLGVFPASYKRKLLEWHFDEEAMPESVYEATLCLVNPFTLANSLYMAHYEMQTVKDLDESLIRENKDLLSFYFGRDDAWCPQEYFYDTKTRFPDLDARLCENGYSHAFVLGEGVHMADLVAEWVKPYF